ncbi:MAG: glycosyltransferase family 2 protein [Anaerolineales bacterium]
MKTPTFSVCIPNYNYARYIGETIQSVLDQTYQQFEIIVADNASTDNSVEVIESFKDARIRLIRNRYNIGFAPNLQRASMFAQNDFVNLLSSDDLMNPTALETYAAILSERAGTAHRIVLKSDAELIDAEGNVVGHVRKAPQGHDTVSLQGAEDEAFMRAAPQPPDRYQTFSGLDVLKDTLSRLRNFAPFLTVVYPRSLWQAVEGYNAVRAIGPDKFFHYKLLAQNPDVIYVPASLYRYRVHVSPNQESQKTNIKQQLDDYLYTLEYSDAFLASLGLTRETLVDAFLNRVCLKNGLTQLVYGSYTHAFRMLACALASYPKETLHQKRFYMLLGLLACGPFAQRLARLFYGGYHAQELRLSLGEN